MALVNLQARCHSSSVRASLGELLCLVPFDVLAAGLQRGEWVARQIPPPLLRGITDTAGAMSPYGRWWLRAHADSPAVLPARTR